VSSVNKWGAKQLVEGKQLVWNSVALTSAAPTAMVLPPGGASGGDGTYFIDVYGIALSSSDSTTIQQVVLSDGVNSVTWQISTSPIMDDALTPYRFLAKNGLVVSVGGVTAGKTINVSLRGVASKT